MAAIRSLGLHKPAALTYLVHEGILPDNCSRDAYTWETFEHDDNVDELISTETHVVWSGGSSVYRVFSFEIEKEPVQQALFAFFPNLDLIKESRKTPLPLHVRKRQDKSQATPPNPESQRNELERALVVVLQSQAQVFYLSGARAIIPLLFEVERTFPLAQGLLFQRKQTVPPVPGPPLTPKTPANSFVTKPSFIQSATYSQATTSTASPFVNGLFETIKVGHKSRAAASTPFHYYLSDPFSEFGALATSDETTRYGDDQGLFDRHERLIFVSNKDEATARKEAAKYDPLQVAVTVNAAKQSISLWQISKPATQSIWRPHRRATSYDLERKKRRRSSQPGTGAVTPKARQSMNPRESFGVTQESFSIRDNVRDDGDLAAKLDPAFQELRSQGQAPRRISSMLGRSDMPAMDTFADGIGAAARRGASFGGRSSRSFRDTGKRDPRSSLRAEPGTEMSEDEDSDLEESPRIKLSQLLGSSNGMRIDIRLELLQSIHVDAPLINTLRAFLISSSRVGDSIERLTFCLMNRKYSVLHLLEAQATFSEGRWHAKFTGQRQAPDITDACVFRGEQGNRIATLSNRDGAFGIALQAPHLVPFKATIPAQLLINFPYTLQTASSPKVNRSTGPRRVLDSLPSSLRTISTGGGSGQLVVADSQGSHHLLKLSMKPQNKFVSDCLAICETVWRPPKGSQQTFLHGWWQASQFLARQKNPSSDQEWAAFVTLIFSLCCPSEGHASQTPLRTKRRGGGLLRSSSGASVDLDDYHSALSQESQCSSSQPVWLNAAAWQWACEEPLQNSAVGGAGLGILKSSSKHEDAGPRMKKSSFIVDSILLGREFSRSDAGKIVFSSINAQTESNDLARVPLTTTILTALHLFREELKLNRLAAGDAKRLCPILAQLGGWLAWDSWSWNAGSVYQTEDIDMATWLFDEWSSSSRPWSPSPEPPSILRWISECIEHGPATTNDRFASLSDLISIDLNIEREFAKKLPLTARVEYLVTHRTGDQRDVLTRFRGSQMEHSFIECLPEGTAAALRSAIASQQSNPTIASARSLFDLLGRPDLELLEDQNAQVHGRAKTSPNRNGHSSARDYHMACKLADDVDGISPGKIDASIEIDRNAVTGLIFKDDHRINEARKLLHPLDPPTVRCAREPEWSEQDLLEAEQELAKVIAVRTLSVSAGRGSLQFGSRTPLLTERFPTHGFTLSCIMKPSNNSVTAEKETFTEEKVSWAFFHAGAEAGLSIARNAKGIDTSWIVFNKPPEFNNRHAGFLLGLGLNGHLKSIAKWVIYKYFTPKHNNTSVGLLLGLGASYLGTMDSLITRVLSIHVARMLPSRSTELNLSPITQTAGIMGLGLLYYNTQHRRMTEIMISEMENADHDDSESPLDTLRDEGYRLAAGFALGYINLGQGKNLRGLHDMRIVERLLNLAVSTKRVDLMHILDKGTAAATISIALIFMKTEDETLARKINVPNTPHQFEYIRPDLFLLRTVARHLIMWSKIQPTADWIRTQVPQPFEEKHTLKSILSLDIKDLPLYNTVAGLCLAIGLRYAGTANPGAGSVLLKYLDQFMRLARLPSLTYDHRLTRTTVRNCQDVIALAAATVMAGTGNIEVFRRLRSLHGRTDPETPYGSHLAAHQAIGVLFLAGGTHTLKTSNLAVASLLCAFYPLFPSAVLDNKGHLQAFRHMWVLAAESRCLIVRDVDTHRPLPMPIEIKLKSGSIVKANAPCLLPDLTTVASVCLADPKYWRLTLDFERPAHLQAFERHQSIFACRKRVEDTSEAPFIAAMRAASHDSAHEGHDDREGFAWIFELPSLSRLSLSDRSMTLPTSASLASHASMRTTAVDDQLLLKAALAGRNAGELWNLRILFAWAESETTNAKLGWLEREVIGALKAELGLSIAQMEGNIA